MDDAFEKSIKLEEELRQENGMNRKIRGTDEEEMDEFEKKYQTAISGRGTINRVHN